MNGYIQVYTGNGKGKTTAACGLALRAAGAGLKVFFAQFLKTGESSELKSFERFRDRITILQVGRGFRLMNDPSEEDALHARHGMDEIRSAVQSGSFHMVILDEANVAVELGIVRIEDLIGIIGKKPDHVELVFTGRNAHPDLLARADLVTEMLEIKHYYASGVRAREGIEY